MTKTAPRDHRPSLSARAESLLRFLSPPVVGALCVVAAALCYSITAVCIRIMATELNPFMIGLLRNTFGLIFFMPLLLRSGLGTFSTGRWPLHLVRTAFAVLSALFFFWGIARVPLADAIALNFAAPIFAAVFAVIVFGERMGLRRWTATLVGFVGILIILRPGFQTINLGLVAVLLAALCWAVMVLCNKALTRTDTMTQIVILNLVVAVPVSLALAIPVWQTPGWDMVLYGAIQGLLGTTAHFLVAKGFQIADASHIMPFDFLRLPFTIGLAFVFFSEVPDLFTVLGATVVFASTTYIALRSRRVAKRALPVAGSVEGDAAPIEDERRR